MNVMYYAAGTREAYLTRLCKSNQQWDRIEKNTGYLYVFEESSADFSLTFCNAFPNGHKK